MIDRDELRNSVASFCQREANLQHTRKVVEGEHDFDPAMWQAMAEMGWAGMLVPESLGGLGLNVGDMMVVAEELGRSVVTEPLLEVAVTSALVLSHIDSGETSQTLLEGLASGSLALVCVNGEDLTLDNANGKGIALNGQTENAPLVSTADGYLLQVLEGSDPALLWIPRETQGLSLNIIDVADGTRSGVLVLKDVVLSEDSILCRGGKVSKAAANAAYAATATAAAYLQGLSEQLFEVTLDYLRTRKQFGVAIGSFQALQHRSVDLFIQRALAQSVVAELRDALIDNTDLEQHAAIIARASHRVTRLTEQMIKAAVQLHGAIGFTTECDVSLFVNRAIKVAAVYGNAGAQAANFLKVSPPSLELIEKGEYDKLIPAPSGNDWNSMSDEDFRLHVRQFIESEYPEDRRYISRKLLWDEIRDWHSKVYEKGWAAPSWPKEHGGMGLEPSKLIIFTEEQERWGVARVPGELGVTMVGPLLIKNGTREQQEKFLPGILSGKDTWCQGYSEPNSGSDLASLKTTATLDGDEFVVNGQKTWTTRATESNWMFVLARTEKSERKQEGISFLLMDFSSPGITVRPIDNLAGNPEFAEVFLDNVRVPKENLVGELNKGWGVAKSLLSFERLFLGSPKHSQYALNRLQTFAMERELTADPVFMARFNELRLDVLDLESAYTAFADQVKRGLPLGPDISLLKVWGTETCQRICDFLVEVAGADGGVLGKVGSTSVDVMNMYYYSRPGTIYGGSNEIQRNILAKQVLNLPSK